MILFVSWLPAPSDEREFGQGMSEGHHAGRNTNKMHSFPSESGRHSPVSSPNLKNKLKRDSGYGHDSWPSSPLARETLKRNADEGSHREVNCNVRIV